MASIEVTISELQNAANTFTQAAENFRNAAQEVLNSAQQLSDVWEGDSHAPFLAEQEQTKKWCNNLTDIINLYVEGFTNGVKAYQSGGGYIEPSNIRQT